MPSHTLCLNSIFVSFGALWLDIFMDDHVFSLPFFLINYELNHVYNNKNYI